MNITDWETDLPPTFHVIVSGYKFVIWKGREWKCSHTVKGEVNSEKKKKRILPKPKHFQCFVPGFASYVWMESVGAIIARYRIFTTEAPINLTLCFSRSRAFLTIFHLTCSHAIFRKNISYTFIKRARAGMRNSPRKKLFTILCGHSASNFRQLR